jgi:dTDP-4-amino-4,6-dideoxygalactose transaminase
MVLLGHSKAKRSLQEVKAELSSQSMPISIIDKLLWGHYNKRCNKEIPDDHPLQKFSLTGTGNKHRAHPLAVALALNQLRKLSSFYRVKSRFAEKMIEELAEIPFLAMPVVSLSNGSACRPAWYAMVFQFVKEKAPSNMTRDNFVAKLLEAGLEEIDIPKSTGLLHNEPLFTNPKEVLPHVDFGNDVISSAVPGKKFVCAHRFYDNAIKFPVFADLEDEARVDYYILTIKDVARAWV